MKKSITLMGAFAAVSMFATAATASTLDDVKARGNLNCGVSTGLPGFSAPDDKNNWTGLDVDTPGHSIELVRRGVMWYASLAYVRLV